MRLTSLENTLHADRNGSARKQALGTLQTARQQIQLRLREPSMPGHYRSMATQLDACLSAERVIETLWQRYHGDPSSG